MSNKFVEGLETVGKDIVKAVEAPVVLLVKAEKVIETAIKDQPALKSAVTTVVKDAVAISAKVAAVVGEKGLNLADDEALLEEIKQFFLADIETGLIPVVEKVYGEVKADLS